MGEGCTKEGHDGQGLEGLTVRSRKGSRTSYRQAADTAFIAKFGKRLYRAYLIKEKLRLVFQCEDVSIAKAKLDGWIGLGQHCRIRLLVELQRKIRAIMMPLATMEHHLSKAVLEATNRKIQLSVYMAYGFRNNGNLIDMIMLRCSDNNVRFPWEYQAAQLPQFYPHVLIMPHGSCFLGKLG